MDDPQPTPVPPRLIWLASRSPRRAQLLAQAGIGFGLLLDDDADSAETLEQVRVGEPPNLYVRRVARAKLEAAMALRAARGLEPRPILAADTTVAIGGRILGKPADAEDGARMLRELSGRTHRVLTAVSVARGTRVRHALQVSRVRFARLKPADIDAYVACGEGKDKAGGYAIQGHAAAFIRTIQGSPSGIMGLPLYETLRLLGMPPRP